jgi:hypothetical protein
MIRATAFTADYSHTAKFDATAWFASAEPMRIVELVNSEWTMEPADRMARDLAAAGGYSDLSDVISQIDGGAKLPNGDLNRFETYVDPDDALAWIEANRPDVHARIVEAHGADANFADFGKLFWDEPHHAFSAGYEGPGPTGPRL